MADVLKKVPVREQAPNVRAANFEEVCLGYNKEEAMEEAARCINCKNAKCVQGCPVSINIPAFIHEVKEGNIEAAYQVISESSALPAICGRVCPQESQCEGKCIRGIKGEPISIGKLERFVADAAREQGVKPVKYGFVKALGDEMKQSFPDFQENPYYLERTGAEEKKLIRMQMRSTVLFMGYYKLLWTYRKLRKRLGI